MPIDIPDALQSLDDLVDRIAALIEWDKLAQQERRPDMLASSSPRDSIQEDVKSLYGAFVESSVSIREFLDLPDSVWTPAQRTKWLKQLNKLQRMMFISLEYLPWQPDIKRWSLKLLRP